MEPAQFVRERDADAAVACIPTRSSLLTRLKDANDHEGWIRFYETYWRLIYNSALLAGLTAAEAEDVVQETLIAVWKNMPGFEYDRSKGSFKAWLLQQTAWRIKGQLRKRLPVEHSAGDSSADAWTALVECVPDPAMSALEASWNEEWEKNLFQAALRRVRAKADARQYQIFDVIFRLEWPPSKVASTFRISLARVYLVKHRIRRLLKQELIDLQERPL